MCVVGNVCVKACRVSLRCVKEKNMEIGECGVVRRDSKSEGEMRCGGE